MMAAHPPHAVPLLPALAMGPTVLAMVCCILALRGCMVVLAAWPLPSALALAHKDTSVLPHPLLPNKVRALSLTLPALLVLVAPPPCFRVFLLRVCVCVCGMVLCLTLCSPIPTLCLIDVMCALPCGDTSVYCPSGTPTILSVPIGYYSLPEEATGTLRYSVAVCPSGQWCANGTRINCAPGTYNPSQRLSVPCSTLCPAGPCASWAVCVCV